MDTSLTKIIEFLPFIIISVIILVGFFTWEVFTKHISVFVLLITSILFSLWLYSGDIYSYIGWKKAADAAGGGDSILPSSTPESQISPESMIWVVLGVILLLGLGLVLGITSYKIGNRVGETNQSSILEYISYGFLGAGGIILISVLWKAFQSGSSSEEQATDEESIFQRTGFKLISGLVLAVIGIFIKVRSVNISSTQSQQVNPAAAVAGPVSNVILNVGLIFQVIAVLATLYMMYSYKMFHPDKDSGMLFKSARYISFLLLFIAGFLFIATQQKWIPTVSGIEADSDQNNMFGSHGIVYMVLAGISLIGAMGNINKLTAFKIFGYIVVAALISVIIWNFVELNQQRNFNLEANDKANGNAYYQQVRDEVLKELAKTGDLANKSQDESDAIVKAKIEARVGQLNTSNNEPIQIVNNVLLGLAVIITIIITIFYFAKMKVVECMKLPSGFMNIFKGECDDVNSFKENTKLSEKFNNDAANIEKMTGDDWGDVLKSFDETAGFKDKLPTHLASLSRWNPFLSIILVILCISILFTKVTTSDTTMEWIAKSFRGDMFPRVKELLDTFFIIFIVGLLLCAILLLPKVKEMNVGGLNTITKFIDSIQVWQWKESTEEPSVLKWIGIIVLTLGIAAIGLSWLWKYLAENGGVFPKNMEVVVAVVIIYALCCLPIIYHLIGGGAVHEGFAEDNILVKGVRTLLTSVYLVPVFLLAIFKLLIYGVVWVIGKIKNSPELAAPLEKQTAFFNFTKWHAAKDEADRGTDLRLFGLGKIPIPADVTAASAAAPAAAAAASAADASANTGVSSEQTKVNAVGSLIKVIFIVIAFVVLILAIIYSVYKIGANNKSADESATADGGFVTQMNSPTAHIIYVIIAILGIAGLVAYLREKFKTTNQQTPENYLFNDFKPEDISSPMRQLTFGMTHIIYIVLMIIVWVYDTDIDDKNRMSVTGMTVLGLAILFFHYGLEFIDNKKPGSTGADAKPEMEPMSKLFGNIRFIVNTIFFILLCALAYFKQHGIMVALIVFMFFFHLTKSIIGVKLLKLVWACIIYIPCLFLDFLQSSQGVVGDTTPPIWIIVAIELLLIAILYGGPYLINYIGASASQIVSAPVSLKQIYDTNLTTQSPKIFIYHNTGVNRTQEDKSANCPVEEKMRYNYSISGWFFLNNNVTTKNTDLEIFNFGDVPRLTYNPSKNELKLYCNQLSSSSTIPNEKVEIYNSRTNYNAVVKDTEASKRTKIQILTENEELDADVPLQRWNYFVVNYDGKTMDLFLNNKLIFKSDFIMPDIQLKPITVGSTRDNRGLNGSICNFAFHKYPLTKEQIRWTYTMLKGRNPPMIGMPTIEDEVKAAGGGGSNTMYSR